MNFFFPLRARPIFTSNHGGHLARTGEVRNSYKILAGIPEGKRPLGRPIIRRRIILKLILGKQGKGI
jgi:hypothetical protein